MKKNRFICYNVALFLVMEVHAAINFVGRESAFVMHTNGQSNGAKLRIGPANGVNGWKDGSIIKNVSNGGEGDYNLRNCTMQSGDDYEASAETVGGSLVYGNSNAINYYAPIIRNTSYYAPTIRNNSYWLRVNSNAINDLNTQFSVINGPHEEVDEATYTLSYDMYLDASNPLTVNVSSVIDGAGHSIWFARDQLNVLRVSNGATVTLTNVVLKDFDDTAIQLGTDASITFGDGTVVELAAPASLNRSWTFAGTSKINGFGNKLTLSYFNLGILQPGTLTLQDVVIDGLKTRNLRCIGNTATMVLRDCQLVMSNNLSFTTGALQVEHDVKVTGSNTLSYETTRQSTIDSQTTLLLDTGVTFSYSPRVAQKGLLAFTDATSCLYLNGCTLKMTTTGMQLTKGTLVIDHKNSIYNDNATSISQAFTLGNGTAADDLTVEVMPGGNIEMLTGRMVYANSL